MAARVRNRDCVPYLSAEGTFSKPLVPGDRAGKVAWRDGLTPFQRMHLHQTLASARRFANFHPFSGFIPSDQLDLLLASSYNHSTEVFPDHVDVLLQPETVGWPTWRRLRNTKDRKSKHDTRVHEVLEEPHSEWDQHRKRKPTIPYRYNSAHPVLIGGITERKHPSNVKLMNTSHHSSQTNAGYSRQDSDGNVYQY